MKAKFRQFSLFAVSIALSLTMIAPATADQPIAFPLDPDVFPSTNPCTGETHTVTIFFDVLLHNHKNNLVATVIRTGVTSDGFEMFAGRENIHQNSKNNIFKQSFVDMWRSDDGGMFQARLNFVIDFDTFDVKVDNFRLKCLGGETLL